MVVPTLLAHRVPDPFGGLDVEGTLPRQHVHCLLYMAKELNKESSNRKGNKDITERFEGFVFFVFKLMASLPLLEMKELGSIRGL